MRRSMIGGRLTVAGDSVRCSSILIAAQRRPRSPRRAGIPRRRQKPNASWTDIGIMWSMLIAVVFYVALLWSLLR